MTSLAPCLAMPSCLGRPAHHEAGDVLQEHQRDAALAAQLDEVGALHGRVAVQDAVVAQDAHGVAVDVGEAAHQGVAVAALELVELRAVDDARDDLVDVELPLEVSAHDAIELVGRVEGRFGLAQFQVQGLAPVEVAHRAAGQGQGVAVVLGKVVGHAGDAGVHVGATELLGRDLLAGGGLDQGRAAQVDGGLLLDHDGLVGHGRHVGAAGGAHAHDHGDLGDALGGHGGLIAEDAPEVVAVGEDLVLVGEVGAAGVHQVDARQVVLRGDLLGPQMLLHRERVVGAALHGGVVHHDHAFAAHDPADAGDDAGGGHVVAVHAVGGELAQFQERRAGVQQRQHAVAGQELAASQVAGLGFLATAAADGGELGVEVVHQGLHGLAVPLEAIGPGQHVGADHAHAAPPVRRWLLAESAPLG